MFHAMKHPSFEASCGVCQSLAGETPAIPLYHPHFHAHMVPRYATMPRDAKAWSVFDLQRAVGAGEVTVDRADVERIMEAYRQALRDAPPP
jgi:hypothetical protein